MATLDSTLTAAEIVKSFKPDPRASISFSSRWGNDVFYKEPSWRSMAFSKIAALQVQEQKTVPGLGVLKASESAANALRRYLQDIKELSLPFPRIDLATGGAILLTWKSGERSIEIASFPDGGIVLEALDHGVLDENVSEQDIDSAVSWLALG